MLTAASQIAALEQCSYTSRPHILCITVSLAIPDTWLLKYLMKPSTWSTLTPSSVLISMLLDLYTGRLLEDAILEVLSTLHPAFNVMNYSMVPHFSTASCAEMRGSLVFYSFAWAKDELGALFILDKTLPYSPSPGTSLLNSVVFCDNHFDSSLDMWHTLSLFPSPLPFTVFIFKSQWRESLGCTWARLKGRS